MRFIPGTEIDFRGSIEIVMKCCHQFHIFQLPSEKLLHVVLGDIPEGITEEEIRDALTQMSFAPDRVVRVRRSQGICPWSS